MRFRLLGLIGIMVFMVSFASAANPPVAEAALTLNNFVGFETNGVDEALGSAGSPTLVGTPVHSGDFALEMNASTDDYDIAIITGGSTDSDNDFILGFAFQTDTTFSTTSWMVARDDSAGSLWVLNLTDGGDITLIDAAGATIVTTTTDPIDVDTWHFIEIRWQHLASGDFDLHIDGASVISETALDLTDGNSVSQDTAFYHIEGDSSVFYFDDFYAYSGGTGTGDFLGDAEVFRYQANTNDTAADIPGGGDALSQGVWQDLGETPLSADGTEPGYTGGAQAGLKQADDTQSGNHYRPGPNLDSSIDGTSNMKGGKSLWRLRRGNGSGTTHYGTYGNSGNTTNYSSVEVTLTNSFANYFIVTSTFASAGMPESDEYFALGMRKTTGGRDIFGEELWGFILHVPDAEGAARRIFPVH